MTTVAQLTIEMAANVARLRTDMAAARNTVDGAMKGIRQSAATAVRALQAIGAGVSVAALGNMVRNFAAAGEEIQRFSTLANTSVEDFQRMAFAAQRYGISQEKLADILKDTQDKVGDFLQTGAGPLADFFENVAPKVGVTADQFRRLSGPEALQLYVSSLQKANLSQAELTFFMEAIASDSTLLLPLLRNNGQAMQELGDQAQRLGQVLDKEAIAAAKKFNDELTLLGSAAEGFGRSVALPIIESLNGVIEKFRQASREGKSAFSVIFASPAEIERKNRAAGAFGSGPAEDLRKAQEQLAALEFSGIKSGRNFEVARQRVLSAQAALTSVSRDALRAMDRDIPFSDPVSGSGSNAKQRATAQAAGKAQAAAAQRAQAEALQKIITLADYRNKQFDEEFQKEETARLAVEDRIRSAREMAEAIERETALIGLNSNQRELAVALMDLERQGITQGTEAYALRDRVVSAITAKQAKEAALAEQQTQAAAAKAQDDANKQRTAALADSIEQGILTGFRGGMSVADVFLNELKAQFAKTVLRPVIEPIAAAGSALLSSAISSFLGGFPSFAGGGYTGMGARSGGMDGQGGYLAMLHPRETVVDHTKGQGAAPVSIVIHNTIGDVASQSNVVQGMQQVRQQIMGELSRSRSYGGAAA